MSSSTRHQIRLRLKPSALAARVSVAITVCKACRFKVSELVFERVSQDRSERSSETHLDQTLLVNSVM